MGPSRQISNHLDWNHCGSEPLWVGAIIGPDHRGWPTSLLLYTAKPSYPRQTIISIISIRDKIALEERKTID